MKLKVYSKEGCPKCRMLTNTLQNRGIEYEHHNAADHREPQEREDWRTNGSVDLMAGLALYEGDLPIAVMDGRAYDYEGIMQQLNAANRAKIIEHADKNGYNVRDEILLDVEENDFNCPCKAVPVKCPCPAHTAQIESKGECGCGLYWREDNG